MREEQGQSHQRKEPETKPEPNDSTKTMLENSEDISEQNREYFHSNYRELQEEFGGYTVFIVEHELVEAIDAEAADEEINAVVEALRDEYGDEAIDRAYIEYVPKQDEVSLHTHSVG